MKKPPEPSSYRHLRIAGFSGWIDAGSRAAALLSPMETPLQLAHLEGNETVGEGRNQVIRIAGDPVLWVKIFAPRGPLSFLRYIGRGTKADKAWNIAFALNAAGVTTPRPLAGLSGRGIRARLRAVIVYEDFAGAGSFAVALKNAPATQRAGLLAAAGRYLATFHDAGFRHRDLQGSNLLVRGGKEGYEFMIIDINRARYHPRLSRRQRLRDLERLPLEMQDFEGFFRAYAGDEEAGRRYSESFAASMRLRERLQHLPRPFNRIARRLWYYWREISTFSLSRPV